jgi:hypothetical protein
MLNLAATTYLIPCIKDPSKSIGLDIADIVKAESRLADVAIVNIQTAPDLLTTFNRNWLDLHRMVSLLGYEKNQAENLLKRTKAEALLGCNDAAIKAKGHSKASADLRDAITELDSKVIEAKDRLDELNVLILYLKGKQDAFQKGYDSVKKLVGAGQLPLAHHGNGNRPQPFIQQKQNIYRNEPVKTELVEDEFGLPLGFK